MTVAVDILKYLPPFFLWHRIEREMIERGKQSINCENDKGAIIRQAQMSFRDDVFYISLIKEKN